MSQLSSVIEEDGVMTDSVEAVEEVEVVEEVEEEETLRPVLRAGAPPGSLLRKIIAFAKEGMMIASKVKSSDMRECT